RCRGRNSVSEAVTVPSHRVLDLLTGLVDASLVVYEEQPDGTGRYRLPETTRHYAQERLQESGESDAVREWHQRFLVALAEEAEPLLHGSELGIWLDRLEMEHDNLRTALEYRRSDATEDADAAQGRKADRSALVALRIAGALSPFWLSRGYLIEGR